MERVKVSTKLKKKYNCSLVGSKEEYPNIPTTTNFICMIKVIPIDVTVSSYKIKTITIKLCINCNLIKYKYYIINLN